MATTSFKILKNFFAREIGREDYTAVDLTGEALINDAHKEMSSRFPFKCNKKTAALSVAGGSAAVPTDFDYAHEDEIEVYSYSGAVKTEYKPVDYDEISRFAATDYVFAIDYVNDLIKSNQTTATPSIDYYIIPADLSANTQTTKFPVPRAVATLAAGNFWNGVEGGEARAKDKFELADKLFSSAIERNKITREYGLKNKPTV